MEPSGSLVVIVNDEEYLHLGNEDDGRTTDRTMEVQRETHTRRMGRLVLNRGHRTVTEGKRKHGTGGSAEAALVFSDDMLVT